MAAAVHLRKIEVDLALQPRVDGLDPDHVRELQETAETWPPLVVVERDSRLVLVDGFHRFAAAQNLGLDTIPVRIVPAPEDGDLHGLAFDLNAAHGRPLSLADRRAFAARLLREHADWADREIGRRCGLAQPTVARVREELERDAAIAPVDERVGRDGRTYRASANAPPRPAGEMPETSLLSAIGDMFSPAERRQQRQIAHYLQRLAVALADQYDLAGWESIPHVAQACRLVLGEQRAADLAAQLGRGTQNVLAVATELGLRLTDDAE